jgi:hypothetical protein
MRAELKRRRSSWVDDLRSARLMRYSAALYGIAWLVHSGDHLRRGFGVETTELLVLGTAVAVLQLVAIGLVFARHDLAPLVAVAIGIPDGIGIAALHLVPHWSVFSDAFPGAHGTGVTAFSWFAAILEVVAAFAFAGAGIYSLRRDGWPWPAAAGAGPTTRRAA